MISVLGDENAPAVVAGALGLPALRGPPHARPGLVCAAEVTVCHCQAWARKDTVASAPLSLGSLACGIPLPWGLWRGRLVRS